MLAHGLHEHVSVSCDLHSKLERSVVQLYGLVQEMPPLLRKPISLRQNSHVSHTLQLHKASKPEIHVSIYSINIPPSLHASIGVTSSSLIPRFIKRSWKARVYYRELPVLLVSSDSVSPRHNVWVMQHYNICTITLLIKRHCAFISVPHWHLANSSSIRQDCRLREVPCTAEELCNHTRHKRNPPTHHHTLPHTHTHPPNVEWS